ncbi:c-type cytochrome [Aestuariibacter halophilus]|uniref:C-type cytochrome n=1 Tax=Fluctibacter halophilus TaxID=226011 RepID=A0ABS8G6F7_9ALTE|nr:c-type cytochrome [Aestuariibacter halophilus]MCC2615279.1 c-type cytochrome [Aestuariibacter halophilus]
MKKTSKWYKWIAVLLVVVLIGGVFTWQQFFRVYPQPDWVFESNTSRFKYGSIGGEHDAGIPYWIFVVLPRMFPEYLPGNGGYAALGVPWEEGKELPVGFVKKTIGFERVGNNCAVCHTTQYRLFADSSTRFAVAGAGHTANIEGFFKFIIDCAKDPRFNPDNLLAEIAMVHELSFVETLIYRFVLIPITKKRLLEREAQFAWIYRHDFPDWGRGRDDAMNLTKYFMIGEPMDDTFGPTDMPSIWNLQKYDAPGRVMNWDGATHDAYSVIMDSALGLLGAEPHDEDDFLAQVDWLHDYLRNVKAPPYPLAVDNQQVQAGEQVFNQNCASCHASERTGTPVPLAEIGTSAARLETWNKQAAIAANRIVEDMGLQRKGLVEETLIGYVAVHLDGIWLRAPYLHNGSVPTLWDLLQPASERPQTFYRGYDLFDPQRVGFVSQGEQAKRAGTLYDTRLRGNSNQGHEFGVTLSDEDKQALIAYLKTQ